jgi:glucokinase
LYEAVCATQGCIARELQPADVTDGAISRTDAQCVLAVRYFTQFLGNVAANLALTLGSRGGVYIGGGIVPRLGASFDEGLFRESFEDKGRYRDMLAGVPVWVITASTPALMGASRALDAMA